MNRKLATGGAALLVLIAAGQFLHDGSEVRIGSDVTLAWFVLLQSAAGAVYLLCVVEVLRADARPRDVWLVLLAAATLRAVPLCSPMVLSSDAYRYVWDGRVQLAGINPYVYIPADPALAFLRDARIFSLVNRAATAHTIYPPTAQLLFAAVTWVSDTPRAMRVAMVACEALAVAALATALRRRGEPCGRLLIYAWNPLAVWEFAGNGHVDALAIAFLALALLARTLHRPAATGTALACAVLVKFLPAVVAPALWRPDDGWRLPLAGLVTVVALYGCYAGGGAHLLGFLEGYADEEGMRDGSGIWALAGLSRAVPLPAVAGRLWMVAVAVLLAVMSLWIWRHRIDPPRAAAWLLVALMLALGPHYPWYYPWLAVPAVLAPMRAAIWLSVAAVLLYLSPLHERFIWPGLVFVPALVLAALDLPHSRRMSAPFPTGA